jgi:hypothetical protein
MGNEGNMWLNVPVETKETEATMCLLQFSFISQALSKKKNYQILPHSYRKITKIGENGEKIKSCI